MVRFGTELAHVLGLLQRTDAYLMGDLNVNPLKLETHGPTSDYMGEFTSGGFYPLISLPTWLTDTTATLIDNVWTTCNDREHPSMRITHTFNASIAEIFDQYGLIIFHQQ